MPVNGAEVTTAMSVAQATDYGAPLRYDVNFTIRVWLDADGQTAITTRENKFRAALQKQNQNFILYTDDNKPSSASIMVDQTANGTRVTSVSNPEAQGAEFVNRRTVVFVVNAQYHVADTERAVVSWQETLTIVGNGGPRRSWRFPVGPPPAKGIRQIITPYSLVRAVQAGRGVGYAARPNAPAMLFPAYRVNESETYGFDAPQLMGVGYDPVNFGISWSYTFERGDGPLVGFPRLPPGVI